MLLLSLLLLEVMNFLRDPGDLYYFLGFECHHDSTGLVLSQRKYILDLFKKTNLTNCKPVSSLLSHSTKLSTFDSTSMEDLSLYRSVVGSLQYCCLLGPICLSL